MTASKRNTLPGWVMVLMGICVLSLLLSGVFCWIVSAPFRPIRAPKNFPDTDIIYNAGGQLGFVNADGSGNTTVPFNIPYFDWYGSWQTPLLTGDGRIVLVTHTTAQGYPGDIFANPAGERAVRCLWAGKVRIAADGEHILVDNRVAIAKYTPAACGTGDPPEQVFQGVSGALSPDEQYAAEVREKRGERGLQPYIVLRDLSTGQERDLGEGDFPVWSRDGQWLAYTGVDGIYILPAQGDANARLLVSHKGHTSCCAPAYQTQHPGDYFAPIASWSPDGKWLVYQLYSEEPIDASIPYPAKYYLIFKVNVETGETVRLLDGGYAPYWRWPPEEP